MIEHPIGRIIRSTIAMIEKMEDEFRMMQGAPLSARSEKAQDIASLYMLLDNLHDFMAAMMADEDEEEDKDDSGQRH